MVHAEGHVASGPGRPMHARHDSPAGPGALEVARAVANAVLEQADAAPVHLVRRDEGDAERDADGAACIVVPPRADGGLLPGLPLVERRDAGRALRAHGCGQERERGEKGEDVARHTHASGARTGPSGTGSGIGGERRGVRAQRGAPF